MALPHATYAAVGLRDDDTVTLRSDQSDDPFTRAARRRSARAGDRLGGVRRRGAVGAARGRLGRARAWTSSSTAGCRSAPGCPARRPWSARWRWPSRRPPARRSTTTCAARLVQACMRAEREVAGAPTGGMDQTIALFGQRGVGAAARLPRLVDAPGALGPGVGRADPAGRGHPRVALAGGRRLRSPAARTARRRPALLGVDLLRDVDGPGRRPGALEDERVRRAGAARVHRDRPGPGGGRPARGRRLRGPGRDVHGLARRRCATTTRSPARSSTWSWTPRWRTARSAPG